MFLRLSREFDAPSPKECSPPNAVCGWVEGWASFFGRVAYNCPLEYRLDDVDPGVWYVDWDIERDTTTSDSIVEAVEIAGILWDLVDNENLRPCEQQALSSPTRDGDGIDYNLHVDIWDIMLTTGGSDGHDDINEFDADWRNVYWGGTAKTTAVYDAACHNDVQISGPTCP